MNRESGSLVRTDLRLCADSPGCLNCRIPMNSSIARIDTPHELGSTAASSDDDRVLLELASQCNCIVARDTDDEQSALARPRAVVVNAIATKRDQATRPKIFEQSLMTPLIFLIGKNF